MEKKENGIFFEKYKYFLNYVFIFETPYAKIKGSTISYIDFKNTKINNSKLKYWI